MPVSPLPVGPFSQTLIAQNGGDTLTGSALSDLLIGGDGDDLIIGLEESDYLIGGAGNDTLQAGRGNDTLLGGDGDDVLFGTQNNNLLFGEAGNDRLESGVQSTLMVGGDGNDTLNAQISTAGANHVLWGGEGADQFNLTFASNAALAFVTYADFALGEDSFSVDGVAGASVLAAGANLLLTATGLRLTLGSGDIITFDAITTERLLQTFGLTGNDTVTGSTGDDRIYSGNGANLLDGEAGNDLLVGGTGFDTIAGGTGNDSMGGFAGNDLLSGGDGDDTIHGHNGTDTLYGGNGADALYAGQNSSEVYGDDGADFIQARMANGGDHLLTGGAGADSFDFFLPTAKKNSHNTITDFDMAEDGVSVGLVWLGDYIALNGMSFVDTAAGAMLSFGSTIGSITFSGHTAAELTDHFAPVVDTIH